MEHKRTLIEKMGLCPKQMRRDIEAAKAKANRLPVGCRLAQRIAGGWVKIRSRLAATRQSWRMHRTDAGPWFAAANPPTPPPAHTSFALEGMIE